LGSHQESFRGAGACAEAGKSAEGLKAEPGVLASPCPGDGAPAGTGR